MSNGKVISVFHTEQRRAVAGLNVAMGAVEQALAHEVTRLNGELAATRADLAAARADVEQLKRERGTPQPNA